MNHNGIVAIRADKGRRFRWPVRFFPVDFPLCLAELTSGDSEMESLLVACSRQNLDRLTAEPGCEVRILAEHQSTRPTLPLAICQKYGFKPGEPLWLVGMGDYVELWSDSAWQALQGEAVAALVAPDPE